MHNLPSRKGKINITKYINEEHSHMQSQDNYNNLMEQYSSKYT